WSRVAMMLDEAGLVSRAKRWLDGWQEREHLDPPTLEVVAATLHASGDHARAEETSPRPLALRQPEVVRRHHRWLAYAEGLRGNAARVREHLDAAGAIGTALLDRLLDELARTLALAAEGDTRSAFASEAAMLQRYQEIEWLRVPGLLYRH